MLRGPSRSNCLALRSYQSRRFSSFLAIVAVGGALGSATIVGLFLDLEPRPTPSREAVAAVGSASQATSASAPNDRFGRLLDAAPSLSLEALTFVRNLPLSPEFGSRAGLDSGVEPRVTVSEVGQAQSTPTPQAAQPVYSVALPPPRPRDLQPPGGSEAEDAGNPHASRVNTAAAVPTRPEDNRSFFEKILGVQPTQGPALKYAALDAGPAKQAPGIRMSPSLEEAGPGTAVYDISTRTVTMPNGEKLEAHSGLGDKLDDPRYVHVRMKGATPPGTYTLTEREQLFHGVRALRLNPVGGSAAVHGRSGLLVHTYLLGKNGDSNGCVSLKDYDRFLQAYLRGEVKRLVVIPGRADDGGSNIASIVRRLSALTMRDAP